MELLSALAADCHRETNIYRRRAYDINDEWDPKRQRASYFYEAFPFHRSRYE